jgi:hypothetical protein
VGQPFVKEEKREHRTKPRTFALRVASSGVVAKSVMKERRVWRILSYRSIPCETPSFIVWMMAGIAERKTARSDEALVGVEGNGDNFGNFRCAVHEYGARSHLG